MKHLVLWQRVIQGVMGLVTILLVARCLTIEFQGWYYTFASIAAIYTVFDMGLSVALVQLSAHIFSRLKWRERGDLEGDLVEQFLNLSHQSVRFYFRLSLLYLLVVGLLGVIFFSYRTHNVDWAWTWPWISLVFFTALNILTLPFVSLIEGSGKVDEVYYVRIIQNLLGSLSLWGALILGYQLWALSLLPALSFLVAFLWIIKSKPIFLKSTLSKNEPNFNWKDEVWPLQWRIGLTWLAGYLLTQIYTPILFYYDSSKTAGQMGLSLTIANMLGLLAQSWIARRVPDMGKSVANKDWEKFDRIFKRDFGLSLLMYLFGGVLLCVFVNFINNCSQYGQRVLPILPFFGLLAVVLINHINGALASHLRSYKKEPLAFVFLISTLITIPIALYGASEFSANGVIAAILLVQLLFTLPVTIFYWFKFNREWRMD